MFIEVTELNSGDTMLVNLRHIVTVTPIVGAEIRLISARIIKTRESYEEVKQKLRAWGRG